jgi:signal transduction histidine kinase
MTLRLRLILWYSGLLAVVLLIFGIALVSVTRWVLIYSLDQSLTDTSQQIQVTTELLASSGVAASEELILRLPESEVLFGPSVSMQVWDVNDLSHPRLISQSANLNDFVDPIDPVALTQEALLLRDGTEPLVPLLTETRVGEEAWRAHTTLLPLFGRTYVLQVGTSMQMVNNASQGLLVIIGLEMVMALIGSLMLGWALTNRTLRRIDVIATAADRVSASEDLKKRLPYDGPMDEIGRLTAVYNQMMCRLEHLFSVQQRFVGDVSHELRTPLTAIRGHVDLIKRYGMEPDSLEAIESEVNRMNRMVSDLLLLAKADYGGLTLNTRLVDLDELVSEVYRSARGLTKERNLKLMIREYEPIQIEGDPDRLTQLLLNLVSNAIKFTPDGGEICINLRHTPTEAVLEVKDTGIGISEDDMQRVFDRFFQADTSRVRGEGLGRGEGVGLGLSIAKWIVDAHHGRITVASKLGEGTTFTVYLPLIEPVDEHQFNAVTRPRLGNLIRRGNGEATQVAQTSQAQEPG